MSLDGPNDSMTTMSTAHVVRDVRSTSRARSDTMRSFSKPTVTVQMQVHAQEKDEVPDVPFVLQGSGVDEACLKEIGGHGAGAGVGVAF